MYATIPQGLSFVFKREMLGKKKDAPPNQAGVCCLRKRLQVGKGKNGKVCELIRKSVPRAASHIDEKIISLFHRWLVKKKNPNLS